MENAGAEKLFPAGVRIKRIFTAPELASGAVALPAWDDPGMRLCKQRSRGRAVCGNGVFLKEYVYRSPWQRFRRRFGVPRPFVALEAARRLETLGIPTPRVLAAVRGVAPDGAVHDLVVTEELPSDTVFGDAFAASPECGGASELACELVPIVCRMHDGGVCHGDLSLRNWYRASDGAWGVIDLDGARVSRRVSRLDRSRELARLASSCFVVGTAAEDDSAKLKRVLEPFRESYRKCGGEVFRRIFERRSRMLADRFRRKYLKLEKLK